MDKFIVVVKNVNELSNTVLHQEEVNDLLSFIGKAFWAKHVPFNKNYIMIYFDQDQDDCRFIRKCCVYFPINCEDFY